MLRRVTAVTASALVLVACGGSSGATTAPAPSSSAPPTGATVAISAGAGDPTATVVAPEGTDRRAQLQAWRDCLASNGVTLPTVPAGQGPPGDGGPPSSFDADGGPPPSDGSAPPGGRGGLGGNLGPILQDPANAAAVSACASLQPQGAVGGPGGEAGGQRGQAMAAYLSCLRDNGVAVPTTVVGGPPASVDRESPELAAANEKCQVLLPQRPDPPSTTTTAVG